LGSSGCCITVSGLTLLPCQLIKNKCINICKNCIFCVVCIINQADIILGLIENMTYAFDICSFVNCVKPIKTLWSFFPDLLKFWLDVLTIMKTFENFVHSVLRKWFTWFAVCVKWMKTYNLFRTITKCSDHCVNYFENSDPSLEKCVKLIEKNCKYAIKYQTC